MWFCSIMGCILFLEVLYDIGLMLFVSVSVGGEVYIYVLGFWVFKYVDLKGILYGFILVDLLLWL